MHDLIELVIIIGYFVGGPLAGLWLLHRTWPAPAPAPASTVLASMTATGPWAPPDADDLTDLTGATREPSGEAGEEAGECVITKLPPRIHTDRCGCIWFLGGLWSACRPHDPAWEPPVTQWMSEMSE